MNEAYKNSGVDVNAGYKAVELMKKHVKATFTQGVLQDIGGFGGLFMPDLTGLSEPVLVSGTDGVGTKLKIAFLLDKHDTVGIDCVAMCVNDVLCAGATPLFFLDYIATGKNYPEKIAEIVKGVAEGCKRSGCALIGGETAEMPGFYPEDEYDLAGFSVGLVDKSEIIDSSKVKKGDVVIGIASSGVHSNGFSLVRKLFGLNAPDAVKRLEMYSDELGKTLGETLLEPTEIYVKRVTELMNKINVHAMSHITGGGFFENIPRMLKEGTSVQITETLDIPPIFRLMQRLGNITEKDMFNTFNMGTGFCLAVDQSDADTALNILKENGKKAYVMGYVIEGNKEVVL